MIPAWCEVLVLISIGVFTDGKTTDSRLHTVSPSWSMSRSRCPLSVGTHADLSSLRSWRKIGLLGAKLASVKLMGVLEPWNFTGLRWEGGGAKVGMLQSVDGVDAFSPVELE
jgi:hypothetical protein